MPWVGFEPTISVFQRVKTIHTLNRVATVIGTNTYNTSKDYWNDNTKSSTLPLLDAPCTILVSGSVPNLFSSVLVSDSAYITRQDSLVSNLFCLLYSVSSRQYPRPKLASCRPDMKLRATVHFFVLRLSSKRVFRCCVNSLYLAVVTETFLYVLSRNRCLLS
jgi:hypothetical protein